MARPSSAILMTVLVLSLIWEAASFLQCGRPQQISRGSQYPNRLVVHARGRLTMLSESTGSNKEYVSTLLPTAEIEKLWVDSRTLLRLGKKGFQPSHVNSLGELLKAHKSLRVKCNDATADLVVLAEAMLAPKEEEEEPLGFLLRVKGREFMVATAQTITILGGKVE